MANSLLYDDNEDTIPASYFGGLLADKPKAKGWNPDLGMLSLAAGLLEPTPNGRMGQAFANGLKGWAGGISAQRKLDEADAENDPNLIMRKYMTQAAAKAQAARLHPESEKWGMAPFVDAAGKVYQLGSNGSIRELTDMHGRFANPTTVDTGGQVRVINPNQPTAPLATFPKEQTPDQAIQTRPDRFQQTQNADGSFTQTDTNTGKQEVINNPNGPKPPPNEYLNTMAQIRDFGPKVDAYIESLQKRGRVSGVVPGSEQLNLRDQHGALTMAMKDIFGLGVLNGGDMKQIEKQLVDPTEARATLYSNDDLINQAKKTREYLNALAEAKKNEYRNAGYRVDSPVRGLVPFNGQNATVDYTDVDAAEKDLQAHPEWSQETKDAVRTLIDKNSPYKVNKASVPTLKKPSQSDLSAAKAKIAEFANDPTAQANVRDQIIKRMQDAGYDTTGL